jgi:hypothetical protein
MHTNKLRSLAELAELLESQGNIVEANRVHSLFIKEASEFKKDFEVPFHMNLDDALNNYDSENYQVDKDGSWEDAEPISDFREESSDDLMHSPAAVDDNHIIFYNEDEDHVEVMNMIPEHHLDSLHKNPSKQTRFIKRAKD